MSLQAVQSRFYARLAAGEGPCDDVAASARQGLRVYAHAYRATLSATLRDTFEKTHAWLGDDAFEAAARAYVDVTPSRSWTLADYGEGFAERLAEAWPDDPEVGELAWLDWALRRAFDAADAPPLDAAMLGGIDWERARLRPHPSLRLRTARSNAAALWAALARGETPPAAQLLPGPQAVRVWRQGLSPRFASISREEQAALASLGEGATFGAICAALAAEHGEEAAAGIAGAFLGSWITDGLLASIEVSEPG